MKKEMRLLLICCIMLAAPKVWAGPTDFFGGSAPGGGSMGSATDPLGSGGGPTAPPGGGEYTDDEKRMQRKYRANIHDAQELVAKGEQMMKKGKDQNNHKEATKGKIIKEIGEKRLEELKANDPFAGLREKSQLPDATTP